MTTTLLGKKLVFITAHPDDESFLAAGTILLNHHHGGTAGLFCASKGECGKAYLDMPHSEDELKLIREKELRDAANKLGINELQIESFPDGEIEQHNADLEKEILAFIRSSNPDYVISFGPDGYTGHRDHIAIGKLAQIIAEQLNIPFIRFAKPSPKILPELDRYLVAKRKYGSYGDMATTDEPKIHIAVDPVWKLKILAIHQSQFEGINPYNKFPKDIAEHLLSNEYFDYD